MADAAHSLSDLLSDIVTLFVVEAAWAPPDEQHPYGKGRYEAVGSLTVAGVLVATGGGVGWSSASVLACWWGGEPIASLADSGYGGVAVAACVLSLVAKEALFHVTVKVGRQARSQTLIANAWHHRSDALSSVAALIGVAGSVSGMPWLDPASGLVVSALVARAGVDIGWEALQEMMEKVDPDDESRAAIALIAAHTPGVLEMSRLRTRKMGPYSLVDLRVTVDPLISVSAAHHIAYRLETSIQKQVDGISEVLVHIEPGTLGHAAAAGGAAAAGTCRKCGQRGPADAGLGAPPRLFRPHSQVEEEVREALREIPEIRGVSHVITWYLPNEGIQLKTDIICDDHLTIREASAISKRAKAVLQVLPDIVSVDIDLELPN